MNIEDFKDQLHKIDSIVFALEMTAIQDDEIDMKWIEELIVEAVSLRDSVYDQLEKQDMNIEAVYLKPFTKRRVRRPVDYDTE